MPVISDPQTLIREVDTACSASELLAAVRNLAQADADAAIPKLIEVLGFNNPGIAVAAVDGLVRLGAASVPALLTQLDDYNYGARAWAIRALAGIGDPRSLDILLAVAQKDFALSVRRAATRGLGTLKWHQFSPERVQSAQQQVLDALVHICQDGEWIVRYAAIAALETLGKAIATSQPEARTKILHQLAHSTKADESLAVRARSCLAQQRL